MTVQFSYKSYASGMGQDFNLNKENLTLLLTISTGKAETEEVR